MHFNSQSYMRINWNGHYSRKGQNEQNISQGGWQRIVFVNSTYTCSAVSGFPLLTAVLQTQSCVRKRQAMAVLDVVFIANHVCQRC